MHRDSWVIGTGPHIRARLRLFCFSYAGGGASTFVSWSRYLHRSIDVCAVQFPGHESRLEEPAVTCMLSLVSQLEAALSRYLDLPFALFGHSNGALVAFELARRLRRNVGAAPVLLAVSGSGAPHLPRSRPRIHDLPDGEFAEAVLAFNGTSPGVLQEPELRKLMLPVLRADMRMHETYDYRPEAPLACNISAFAGDNDDFASVDEVVAWRSQTSRGFNLRVLPGDHFFLHTARSSLLHHLAIDLAPWISLQ